MSESAGGYYRARSEDLGLGDVPDLLSGEPVCLLMAGERPNVSVIAHRFAAAVTPVENFVLDGVHGVHEAEGSPLTIPEWRRVRNLKPLQYAPSALKYADAQAALALVNVFPFRGGEIYLEALARSEVPQRILHRATTFMHTARLAIHESAQAYLLARTTGDRGQSCTAAHFTMLWADHTPGYFTRRTHQPEALTVRYGGSALLNKETAVLPPLVS
jgi:hypothetical protein